MVGGCVCCIVLYCIVLCEKVTDRFSDLIVTLNDIDLHGETQPPNIRQMASLVCPSDLQV